MSCFPCIVEVLADSYFFFYFLLNVFFLGMIVLFKEYESPFFKKKYISLLLNLYCNLQRIFLILEGNFHNFALFWHFWHFLALFCLKSHLKYVQTLHTELDFE